ncbi:hypothetical protein PF008_g21151 [Phytophthora fragariae]|uniref:Uncharacterized protein n=1 Tax=Phytophthora fragariae TaxID=53985 RepID=A0A6G0QXE2_9STRA|nr:hypothetical protein PF008_g21151 [Phytophthora fragariae]
MAGQHGAEPPDPGRRAGAADLDLELDEDHDVSHAAPDEQADMATSTQGDALARLQHQTPSLGPEDADRNKELSSSIMGAVAPWTGCTTAILSSPQPLTEAQARASKIVTATWNPLHKKRLVATMLRDWSSITSKSWADEDQRLRDVAMTPVDVKRGENIREMTADESQVLLAYGRGELELPHPPNFIKATMTPLHRAMLEDIHEVHFNATLTANLSPLVNLKHNANVPHVMLFKELCNANTDGHIRQEMMRCLQRDVKRFVYDGAHTLRLVFYSRRVAAIWERQTLRFQRTVITLHNTDRKHGEVGDGSFTAAQLDGMYAVHVYGGGSFGLSALARAFAQISGSEVLDVEFPRATRTDIYDNRYHVVRFTQPVCPTQLLGVTRLIIQGKVLTLHHFQMNLRKPCSRCYSPRHGTAKCKADSERLVSLQQKASRTIDGNVARFDPPCSSYFHVARH